MCYNKLIHKNENLLNETELLNLVKRAFFDSSDSTSVEDHACHVKVKLSDLEGMIAKEVNGTRWIIVNGHLKNMTNSYKIAGNYNEHLNHLRHPSVSIEAVYWFDEGLTLQDALFGPEENLRLLFSKAID